MSLKAFHVIFITAASALCVGCGVWGLKSHFAPEGGLFDLVFGIGSLVVGVALLVYERYFLRKLKGVSYL
jgi:hypothetical protein